MAPRRLIPIYVTLVVLALVMFATVPFLSSRSTPPGQRRPLSGNPLTNPPGMVDRLVFVDTPDAFRAGTLKNVTLEAEDATAARLVLTPDPETERYPHAGSWTSPEVVTEFPFTELIPSWNPSCPPGTGIYFEVRSRDVALQEWSPWLYIGYWGRTRVRGGKVLVFEHGSVNEDNLLLDRPADAYQVRATFQSFDTRPEVTPSLRRVAVSYSGQVGDGRRFRELSLQSEVPAGVAGLDIPVPFRPQGDSTKALADEVCSPTSVSMVMEHLGVSRPTVENSLAIYDDDYGIFGNWNRAVAYAGSLGFDAWIQRFRNWDQVVATVTSGQPLVCSIRAKEGDFRHPSIYKSTGGHLIVLRGITPEGDAIVNDPASRAKGHGFVYHREDMRRIWLDRGGVAYVIRKGRGAAPAIAATPSAPVGRPAQGQ